MINKEIAIIEIAKLELKKDDVLVIRFPEVFRQKRVEAIMGFFKQVIPDGIAVVYCQGEVELSVISKEKA